MFRVRDRSGAELEVSTKKQAEAWVAVGYALVDEDEKKPVAKRAPRRAASKKAEKSE